jgi:hypothetical protein
LPVIEPSFCPLACKNLPSPFCFCGRNFHSQLLFRPSLFCFSRRRLINYTWTTYHLSAKTNCYRKPLSIRKAAEALSVDQPLQFALRATVSNSNVV